MSTLDRRIHRLERRESRAAGPILTDEERAARITKLLDDHANGHLHADGECRLAQILALLESAAARRAATEGQA